MIPRVTVLLVSALLPLAARAASAPEAATCHRHGDDPRWAAPEWDDRNWTPGNNVPARTGIYWVRFHFSPSQGQPRLLSDPPAHDLSGRSSSPDPRIAGIFTPGAAYDLRFKADMPIDSVFLASPYAYEFYWDGRLLGGSGTVGTSRETEKTGSLDQVIPIPRELLGPGAHVVAIRLSSFHNNFPAPRFDVGFLMSNSTGLLEGERSHLAFPLIGLGGALLVALICALLFGLAGRWRPLLLCSLLSFALAAFYLLIAWRWLHNSPYEWFYPRLLAITWVMTLIAGIFPWLLLEQFAVPRRAWVLVALAPLLGLAWTFSPIYEVKALWLCRVMLAASLGIAGWAAWRRRTGAWFVAAGVLAGLLLVQADRRDFLNPAFFVIFSILVLYLFAMLGLQLRTDRQRAQATLLTTARLETELLKKNLQPHFLLNTLAAVSELIERNPAEAVNFIDDLAAEFRTLALMSGERLVPLKREVELCRAHLKVISARTGRNYSLQVAGTDEEELVPPAIFLTLIENGLVHQKSDNGAVFQLVVPPAETGARYVFVSPGRTREEDGPRLGGTGLRYVRARLEESFPGRWTFSHGPAASGWETVIGWQANPGAGGAA